MTATATRATLYDLADARDILDQWLSEHDGELTPEIEQLLDELEGATNEKIERVALYICEQLAVADTIKSEEQKLAARRKARERAAENLKGYLQRQLERLGKTKVEGVLKTVALQKNPPSCRELHVVDEHTLRDLACTLPAFVTHVPESFSLNKRAIIDASKSGALPPEIAAHVEITQSQSVRIR